MTIRATHPTPASSAPKGAAPPAPAPCPRFRGPDARDVEQLTYLLDLTRHFASTEQRARYLLSSDWLRDRGAHAARRIAEDLAVGAQTTHTDRPCQGCGIAVEVHDPDHWNGLCPDCDDEGATR